MSEDKRKSPFFESLEKYAGEFPPTIEQLKMESDMERDKFIFKPGDKFEIKDDPKQGVFYFQAFVNDDEGYPCVICMGDDGCLISWYLHLVKKVFE